MLFATLSLGLVILPFAVAQQMHDINVSSANGSLTYNPQAIAAQPGDQVMFHFYPKNHTVTQSSFAGPCTPKDGGFNSGFMPVAANATTAPTYTITVNDTQPIWVYCAQAANTPASHCGAGMVFAVNCGADGSPNSFTNFKNAALQIGANLSSSAAASSTAPSGTATAAYGGVTIPPAPTPSIVTDAVTLASSTWTTIYTSYPNSPAPTPASLQGNVITVVVGGQNLTFNPARVSASPRDTIVFEFHSKNHSLVQSSFDDPCRPLTNGSVTGFMSDFFPVAENASAFPTWNMTVNDTAPIWGYCRQKSPSSHCGAGMVFAVNSDESSARNFTAFQDLAEQLNGTSTGSSATPSRTSSATGAAAPFMRISGIAGVTVVLAAVLASL